MTTTPTAAELLGAALARQWDRLRVETGLSAPRLAQLALQAIDDPAVVAAHPVECRILSSRRDVDRARRLARLATPRI